MRIRDSFRAAAPDGPGASALLLEWRYREQREERARFARARAERGRGPDSRLRRLVARAGGRIARSGVRVVATVQGQPQAHVAAEIAEAYHAAGSEMDR